MILLYPKKRKNKDAFFYFSALRGQTKAQGQIRRERPVGSLPGGGQPNSSEVTRKRNLRGGTVLSRRRQRAKARPRSPETTGSHCPLAGHTSSFAPPAAADGLFRGGVTAARAAELFRSGHKKKPQGRNSSFAPQTTGEGAARSPETTGSHCALVGHTGSFAPQAAADGLFRGVTAARAAELFRSEHKKKPQGRNSSFAPQTTGEGAAPLPRNDGLTLPPRGAHKLFRAAGGRGRLISRRHRSAGGSAKWSVTVAPSMRR